MQPGADDDKVNGVHTTCSACKIQGLACMENYIAHGDTAPCAGDQVGHLWWRLLHGEIPLAYTQQGSVPRVAVILIGTNDLGAADCHRNASELLEAAPGIVQRCAWALSDNVFCAVFMKIQHSSANTCCLLLINVGWSRSLLHAQLPSTPNPAAAAAAWHNLPPLMRLMWQTHHGKLLAAHRRVSAVLGVLRTALPQTHLLLQLLLPRGMDLLPLLRFQWPNRGTAAQAAINAGFQACSSKHLGRAAASTLRLRVVFYFLNRKQDPE